MAGSAPIRLGSAATNALVFESGSKITTSDSGIQSCSVQGLYADGSTVHNVIPAAGTTFNSVFGNSYLPSTFKVDYSGGGAEIEYLEGRIARVTITFKRPDPNRAQGRIGAKIAIDSVVNYKSIVSGSYYPTPVVGVPASGDDNKDVMGFPEPIVYVRYSSTILPRISRGFNGLYALPTEPDAAGFPLLAQIRIRWDTFLQSGATITYWNGTAYVSYGPAVGDKLFRFRLIFDPNSLGWQLQKLKAEPQADSSFFDVEEEWRGKYFFTGLVFLEIVPLPPP
jgi:hypothetical protein